MNKQSYINTITSSLKQKSAPVFAIYRDDKSYTEVNVRFYLDPSANVFEIHANDYSFSKSVSLNNKTPTQVIAEFEAANIPISIVPLIGSVNLLSSDYLQYGSEASDLGLHEMSDRTHDGGIILRLKRHNIHYLEETRIRLLVPYRGTSIDPWYARIQTGTISVEKNGVNYIFSVPEYNKQTWSLKYGSPYMDVYGEEPVLLSEKALSLSRSPIYYNKDNIFITLGSKNYVASNIEDVDRWNGIIYTKTKIPNNSSISIDYTYKEQSYIYNKVNLNASSQHNISLLNSCVLFYLIPSNSTNNVVRTETVRHVVGSTVRNAINSLPDYDFPILLLGAIYIRDANSIDGVNVVDTRTRGGGLYEDDLKNEIEANPELSFLWDNGIYDGISYPGSAAIVVEVPERLHKIFTPRELKQKATRFLAAGVMPIISREDNNDPHSVGNAVETSLFKNGDFSSGYDYWMSPTPNVPSSLTGISDSDLTSYTVSGNHLRLSPGERIAQRYITSSAPTSISYQKQSSIDGITFGKWEDVHYYDERTLSGYMMGGTLILGNDYGYTNYRDVEVKSAYSPNTDFTDDLYSEIYAQYKIMTGLSDTSGRIVFKYDALNSSTKTATSWGPGPTVGQLSLLDMWPDPNMTGYIAKVGDALVASVNADGSGISFPQKYSTASGVYYNDTQWNDWTSTVLYLTRLYEKTSDSTYLTSAQSIVNSIVSINPYESNLTYALLGLTGIYTIPYKYRWNGEYYETAPLTLTVDGNNEVDLRYVETNKYLDGARALVEYDSDGVSAFRAVVAAATSKSIFASTTYGGNLTGVWNLNGSSFTGHKYYSFEHCGELAGHNIRLASEIFLQADPVTIPYTYDTLYPSILEMISSIKPYFTGAIKTMGFIPRKSNEFIRGLGNMFTELDIISDGVDCMVKGMIDDNGSLYEVDSFQGRPTYLNPTPISEMFSMFSDIMEVYDRAPVLSEMMFKHNKTLYSTIYGYPSGAKSPVGVSDHQNNVLRGLVDLYNKWQI